MNEIVYRGESNQPLTNSKLVAEVFGKPHKVVLVAIRNILEGSAQNCAVLEMFSESTYLNEQNKRATYVHYEPRWFHSASDGVQWQEGDGVQTEIHRSLQRYEETD